MKIAIGIPTYNRRYLVAIHAQSLCSARLSANTEIIVIDDCSTDYDSAYLRSIYPEKSDIRRRPGNSGGADFAARDLIAQLVETGAEILVLLDSDLIVATDFLEVGVELLPECDGVLSLFNAPSHRTTGSRGPFVLKKAIGAAATLWRRDLAREMLAHVAPGPCFDWRFSEFLINAGYNICVTRNSRVQHLGAFDGQNSHLGGKGDIGLDFSDSDSRNSYRLAEIILHNTQAGFDDSVTRITALENRMRRVESLLGLTFLRRIKKLMQH